MRKEMYILDGCETSIYVALSIRTICIMKNLNVRSRFLKKFNKSKIKTWGSKDIDNLFCASEYLCLRIDDKYILTYGKSSTYRAGGFKNYKFVEIDENNIDNFYLED